MIIDTETSHQNGGIIKKGKSSSLVRQNCKKYGSKVSASTDPMIKVKESIDSFIKDSVDRSDVKPLYLTCGIQTILDYLEEYKSKWSLGTSERNNLEMMQTILSQKIKPSSTEEIRHNVKEYQKTATSTGIEKLIIFCNYIRIFDYEDAFTQEENDVSDLSEDILTSLKESNIEKSELHVKAIEYIKDLPLYELTYLARKLTSEDMMKSRSMHLPVSMIVNFIRVCNDERVGRKSPVYVYTLNEKTFRKHTELIKNIANNDIIIKEKDEETLKKADRKALKMTSDVFRQLKEPNDENALLYADTSWDDRNAIMIDLNDHLEEWGKTVPKRIYKWVQHVWDILYRTQGLKDTTHEE